MHTHTLQKMCDGVWNCFVKFNDENELCNDSKIVQGWYNRITTPFQLLVKIIHVNVVKSVAV